MSSPPMFVKRTKSKTIRTKDSDTTSVTEITNETATPIAKGAESAPKTVISQFKNRTKNRTKPQQRLSFNVEDDNENEETFQVRKSTLSKKMKSGIGASPMANRESSLASKSAFDTIARSEGPRYSAEYLDELRAATNSARPPAQKNTNGDRMDVDSETIVDDTPTFDASEMEGAQIENIDDLTISSMVSGKETIIPSEASIKAAKEKREIGRKAGVKIRDGEEDFISLDVAKRGEGYQGPHPESRLMREDDDLGEGDDDDAEYTGAKERIALSKKGRKEEAAKRKKGMEELLEEADEQDEETMEWEMAQVKRAVPESRVALQPQKKVYKAAPIPTPIPIPTLQGSLQRFNQIIGALTTRHTQTASSVAQLVEDHARFDKEEEELRKMVKEAEEKRAWFGSFHEWIEGVGEFLEEKFPGLERLEEEHVSLVKERAGIISKRREQDDEDDLVLLFGAPPDMMEIEGDTDEFGRAVSTNSGAQSPLRKERRTARNLRHTSIPNLNVRYQSTIPSTEEGYYTDSILSPSDQQDFQLAISSLKGKVQTQLFEDVKAKAFKDPKYEIVNWFKEWRERYGTNYREAFGGLALVQVWEFWARCEVVGWLPFDIPPRIDEFKWYIHLYGYSRENQGEDEEEVNPEDDLPVNMTSTMLIPRLNALIMGGAFDPYSSQQVGNAIDLVEQIEIGVGADNIRFKSLLTSIAKIFRAGVTDLVEQYRRFSSSKSLSTFDPESIAARKRYMNRIVKLTDNLIRWRKFAKERDGLGAMLTELVGVLSDVAERGWEAGGEEVLRMVVKKLPGELIPFNIKNRLG